MTGKLFYPRVTIVGVGLMGGSLGLALKAAGLVGEVVGWGRNQGRLDEAVARGAIDWGTTRPAEAWAGTGLLVFATPGSVTQQIAPEWIAGVPAGCQITDLLSVKGSLVESLTELAGLRSAYVSSHPLCGSEQTGVAAARADLYRGQLCLLTPVAATRKTALAEIQSLWQQLGMSVVSMAPARHDRVVAAVSHLPHLLASALINRVGDEKLLGYIGTGFRDTTRIAGADPRLWAEIMTTNRKELLAELEGLMESLILIRQHLKSGDPVQIREWLRRASLRRKKLAAPPRGRPVEG